MKFLSLLIVVAAIIIVSIITFLPSVAFSASSDTCSQIALQGIHKQLNFHAGQILATCGLSDTVSSIFPSSSRAPHDLGGTSVDIVLPDGVYPHVTQSESQTWVNGSTIVVAYNDSRNASSATCYGNASVSTDGGVTFTDLNQFCSGHGFNYGDPFVFYDTKHGHWVLGDLVAGCGGQGIGVWTSSDGMIWTVGACAHNGTLDDRESAWVDNNISSPFYGRIYTTWNDFTVRNAPLYVASSDDGGVTWTAPVLIGGTTGNFLRDVQVTTGSDGTVFLASMDEGTGGLSPRTNWVFHSENGGISWIGGPIGSSFAAPGTSTCGYFATMFSGYWRYMGWGDIGVHAGVVHYVYTQGAVDGGDIFYTRSPDNGATWSTAIKLNSDTTMRLHFQPSLAVNPSGVVIVTWYDQRNTNGNDYQRFGIISGDNGVSWGLDQPVDPVIIPLPQQPDAAVQPCYAGDYARGFADANNSYDAWTDGRIAISGVNQQDVELAVISVIPTSTPTPCPLCTPTPTPTVTPTATATPLPTATATPVAPDLIGEKSKKRGLDIAVFNWQPPILGDTVALIQNGVTILHTDDTGVFTYTLGKVPHGTTFTYQICVDQTGQCSNIVTLTF